MSESEIEVATNPAPRYEARPGSYASSDTFRGRSVFVTGTDGLLGAG
jgi:hypothetical protein